MRDTFRLFVIVGKAALIAAGGLFALALTLSLFGFNPDHKSAWARIIVLAACLLPIGVGTAWMFRRLRAVYTQREARAVSIAFGVFTPISLGVSMVLGTITGGYADILVRWRYSGAVGAFAGVVIIAAFLNFIVCALVLRITKLAISVEQSD
jgi:fructose-specific phosphotransferase system IIC component